MCGIAGLFNYRTDAPACEYQLAEMSRRLHHRGPDARGHYRDGSLGLAHTRLSIIDIADGAQPMQTPDGRCCLVFNGEIYNYLELRSQLRREGYRFQTRSDTEVILAAYQVWQSAFLARLNGMFSFALWDRSVQTLQLCRDRLGIKPLYWCQTTDGLAFASEIPALRAIPGVATEIDVEQLDEYLSCGYVTAPNSLVRGVRKVLPGTVLEVTSGRLQERRYWNFRFSPEHDVSHDQWVEAIRSTLADSVRLQLRSDVPLGAFLSGGLDSTLICTQLARQLGPDSGLASFCIGVDLPGTDNEFGWARRVAAKLGLDHHEYRIGAADYGELFCQASRALSEPLAEPMIGQLLALSRMAREQVKVVLSGEGADEFWFGYPNYRIMGLMESVHSRLPASTARWIGKGLAAASGRPGVSPRMAKYFRLFAEPLERRYLGVNFFDTEVKQSLLAEPLRAHFAERDARELARRFYSSAGGPEPISRMAAVDCQAWLVDNTLLRSDQLSMAASLELRVPFLDHRLVELACRIPAGRKVNRHGLKRILSQSFAEDLPTEVINRKKVGFPTPICQLFRGAWGEQAAEALLMGQSRTADLFDRKFIRGLLDQHRSGLRDWSRVLLQVLVFEHWATTFDDRPGIQPHHLAA